MPSAGYALIEQYHHILSKAMEQPNCDDLLLRFDQEVPQSRSACDDLEQSSMFIKQEPVTTQDDMSQRIFESLMACDANEVNVSKNTLGSTNTNSNISNLSNLRISKDILHGSNSSINSSTQQMPTSCQSSSHFLSSTISSSNQSSFPSSSSSSSSSLTKDSTLPFSQSTVFSLSPSPSPEAAFSLPTVISSPTESFLTPQTKVNTYVTELGGSGGTMTSFLFDYVPTDTIDDTHALDIMDLDKQPFSFYDELEPFRMTGLTKPNPPVENLVPQTVNSDILEETDSRLEQVVITMRNDFLNVCDSLNIPHDPESWNTNHVMLWISYICGKYNVPDISGQLYPINGLELCSHTSLAAYGESGRKIADELEFWKAACSAFPTQQFQTNSVLPQHNVQMNSSQSMQQYKYSPCVSPAPSTCSNSQEDSLCGSSTLSTRFDSSEDEMTAGGFIEMKSEPKYVAAKVPGRPGPGRGHHKQTIHLWQFLRNLLISHEDHSDCIRWVDRKAGIFKIEDSKKVAGLWGKRKNRPAMNYDKLSRSVRQYYKKGIIKKTDQSKRLVYQFCDGYL